MLVSLGVGILIIAVVIAFVFWPRSVSTSANGSLDQNPPAPVATPSGVQCSTVQGEPHGQKFSQPTLKKIASPATWVLNTNCGQIDVALAVDQAPVTTAMVSHLTTEGWYNMNQCHRLTTANLYVLQCGARNPDGSGDAGLTIPRENLPSAASQTGTTPYPAGTVAMAANSKGVSGNQFFIVYKDSPLAPEYTRFGQVTSGIEVVEYVAANGVAPNQPNPGDGTPAIPLVIETASIRKAA